VDLPENPPTSPVISNRAGTSAAAHVLCYGALSVALAWGLYGQWDGRQTITSISHPVVPAPVADIQTRIDPNVADWSELVRLPGIGETLAKRIVAYRQQQAGSTGREPVFARLEDLDAVRGIGPKTLAKIAEYLSFPRDGEENSSETPGPDGVDTSAQGPLE